MKQTAYYKLLLAVSSGVLLWLSWPPLPFIPLIFIAFLPLLYLEDILSNENAVNQRLKLFLYSYLCFIIWNVSTTFWVWNSSPAGSIVAFTLNSLFMCIPFLLFHETKRITGRKLGYFSLLLYWISFEYLHHQWELTWPWLTLGNSLADNPILFQWYEYTGHLGGSVWILLINILLYQGAYQSLRSKESGKSKQGSQYVFAAFVLVLPIAVSIIMYQNHQEKGKAMEVVVVQPNVDPYSEKFDRSTRQQQLRKLIDLSKEGLTDSSKFLVWPETSIPGSVWVDNPFGSAFLTEVAAFISEHPQLTLVSGVSGYYRYNEGDDIPATARKFSKDICCYDAYNSAILLDSKQNYEFYHKSKLVPGVERMPYPSLLKFLEPLTINLGGISGSLATQEEREVFYSKDSIGIAPAICYESIFGEYMGDYIRLGAQCIFIVTNDGWWGNTPGHKQHLVYASLRAVESRRSIARSANTGISCFINQRGDILQATEYWAPAVISDSILLNDEMTFYTRYGDYFGRIAMFLAAISLLYTFVFAKTKGFNQRNNQL